MSDVKTCLAAYAVSAGAPNGQGVEAVERQIDAYLATFGLDRRTALMALKASFEELRFDGAAADAIATYLKARLAEICAQGGDADRDEISA